MTETRFDIFDPDTIIRTLRSTGAALGTADIDLASTGERAVAKGLAQCPFNCQYCDTSRERGVVYLALHAAE